MLVDISGNISKKTRLLRKILIKVFPSEKCLANDIFGGKNNAHLPD